MTTKRPANEAIAAGGPLLQAAKTTIAELSKTPGLDSDAVTHIQELSRQLNELQREWQAELKRIQEPLTSLGPEHNEINQECRQIEKRLQQIEAGIRASTRKFQQAQTAQDTEGIRVHHRDVDGQNEAKKKAQAELDRLKPELTRVNAEYDAANTQVEVARAEPNATLEDITARARALNEELHRLHKQVSDRPLAVQGVEKVRADTEEFRKARNYHRWSSLGLLAALFLLIGAGSYLIYELYGAVPALRGVGSGGASASDARSPDVLRIATLVGGRVAAVAAFAWLVAFVARLHSAHSQQAVIYQDRMAGLGAAEVIINYGERDTKEEVLRTMTQSYLSLESNAFRAMPKAMKGPTVKDASKLADIVAKVVAAANPAGARPPEKQ